MISKSIELSVQNVHRSSIETEVIPKYEKATREMFRQISDTFTSGTDDYIKRLEDSLERRVRAETTSIEAAMSKLEEPTGPLGTTLANQSKAMQSYVQNELKKIHILQQNQIQQNSLQMTNFFSQMRQVLNSDMEKLLMKHTKDLDVKVEDAIARAQTPAPMLNPDDANLREQLKRMVEHGNFNEAFTKALMASDLPVVVDLMEMVEQNKIFSSDLPSGTALEQNIILSLIQQLSVDLKSRSQIKFAFLQDAILNLDTRHPSAEHIPAVLGHLQSKITEFIQQYPRDNQAKNYKMILMTASTIIQQIRTGSRIKQEQHSATHLPEVNHAFN
jgi:enhancer of mRNA-decapping protein 4